MKYLLSFTAFAVCAFLALSAQSSSIFVGNRPQQNAEKPWRVWATIGESETIWFLRSHKTEEECRAHARLILRNSGGIFPDPDTGQKLPIRRLWCKFDGWLA